MPVNCYNTIKIWEYQKRPEIYIIYFKNQVYFLSDGRDGLKIVSLENKILNNLK